MPPAWLAALALGALALVMSGCLVNSPRLVVQEAFSGSSAQFVGDHYVVRVRATVASTAAEPARGLAMEAGLGADCQHEPAMPGYADLGNLAGQSRTRAEFSFDAAGTQLSRTFLWHKLLYDGSKLADKGCGEIPRE